MQQEKLAFRQGFRVGVGNARSQCAVMVIAPGGHEGSASNKHRGADQWLYVVEGSGIAIVNTHEYALTAGSIILIEAGDTHEIRNTGRGLLKTLNIYVPPAYGGGGDELPAKR